uniref:Peptidase inhibitor 16 n=2 Tax=Rousettus aegyptiacus TaxID=9407 RepID=A0A7J8KEB4_ROUAE|nr:peptidase inhibitor 16 [Rousettus aegyptiacus]
MATDAPPSLTTEDPSFIEILRPIFLDEGPATSPKLTQDPVFKLADKEASRTRMSSRSPKSSLHPKMSLTGTQEPLSHSQEEGKAEAESPLSSEVLVSVSLVQNEPGAEAPKMSSGPNSAPGYIWGPFLGLLLLLPLVLAAVF